MLKQLAPTVRDVELADIDPNVLTAGVIRPDELETVRERFGFSEATVRECTGVQDAFRNGIDVYEDYTFGMLSVVETDRPIRQSDRVAFYFKRNLLLMVSLCDEDGSTEALFEHAMKLYKPESVTLEKVIFAMLDGLIAHDGQWLGKMEFAIAEMEEEVAEGRVDRDFNREIFHMRKELLVMRNYYEQLIDVGEQLQDNENDVFADGALHYFALFTTRAERLSNQTQMMRDSLTQLRESYQAALDYSLNSTMKVLTVLATIFLPLTLIVGWYGMNFANMPELTWEYGYPLIIGVSVVVVALSLWIFKRKKMI